MGTLASMLKSNAWRRSGIGFTSSIANRLIWSLKPPKRKGFSKKHSSLHAQFYSKTRRPNSEKTQVTTPEPMKFAKDSQPKSATFWVLLTQPNHMQLGTGTSWENEHSPPVTKGSLGGARLPTDERKSQWFPKKSQPWWNPSTWDFKENMDEIIPKNEKNKSGISKILPCLYFESFQTFRYFWPFFLKVSPDQLETLSASRKSERTCGLKIWHCFGIGVKKSGLILTTWNPRNICLCAAFQWL